MGTYIYKITPKKVICSDGLEANVAVYAYKPSYYGLDSKRFNKEQEFKSGCLNAEKYAKGPKMTDRFVLGHVSDTDPKVIEVADGASVFWNPHKLGTVYDSAFGLKNQHPVLDDIKAIGLLGKGVVWMKSKVNPVPKDPRLPEKGEPLKLHPEEWAMIMDAVKDHFFETEIGQKRNARLRRLLSQINDRNSFAIEVDKIAGYDIHLED